MDKVINRIRQCRIDGKSDEMNILKTVYGEMELIQARSKDDLNDLESIKIFKRFKLGVDESIFNMKRAHRQIPTSLYDELKIYEEYIPEIMPIDQLEIYLHDHLKNQIKTAKSKGHAIGISMAHLSDNSISVDGKDVAIVAGRIFES